jgi:hypothetical protein
MRDRGYNNVAYKLFLQSPQSDCYDTVHFIRLERFTEQDLELIKQESENELKCVLVYTTEPHWYDNGDLVSRQFKEFMGLCRKIGIYNADFYITCFDDGDQNDFQVMNNNYYNWSFIPYNVNLVPCWEEQDTVIAGKSMIDSSDVETELHVDRIQHNFLHMNFTHRMHRQLFSKFLIKENLIDGNCVSINVSDESQTVRGQNSNKAIAMMQNDDWPLNKNLSTLWRDTSLTNHTHPLIDNDFDQSYYGFLKNAGVYIVSETVFNHPHPYFSEKIVSALLSNRPFIIIGPRGCLRSLKQKGYKTFSAMFDESYDNIIDPSSRMESIFELVKDINARSLDEIKEDVLKCQDKLFHNQNLMLTSISSYEKKVNAPSDVSLNRKQI